ncbi:hypothetical protein MC04F18_42140 [Escherichia coli]
MVLKKQKTLYIYSLFEHFIYDILTTYKFYTFKYTLYGSKGANHGKIMNIPVNKGFPEPSKGTPDPSRTSLFCV